MEKSVADPFGGWEQWKGHAWVSAALVKGLCTRRELVTVLTDSISTPIGVSYGRHLREAVNRPLHSTRVVSVVSLDSCTCDGLQLANLVASAIAHQRNALRESSLESHASHRTPKTELSLYPSRTFGVSTFEDHSDARLNIRTARSGPRRAQP